MIKGLQDSGQMPIRKPKKMKIKPEKGGDEEGVGWAKPAKLKKPKKPKKEKKIKKFKKFKKFKAGGTGFGAGGGYNSDDVREDGRIHMGVSPKP